MNHVKIGEEVGRERRALCRGQGMEKVGHIPESKRSQSVARTRLFCDEILEFQNSVGPEMWDGSKCNWP